MTDNLTSRIQQRLKDLNLSAQKASLRVSSNRDFFRNILRSGNDANPKRETMALAAKALEVSETWLIYGVSEPTPELRIPPDIKLPQRSEMPRDVPVMGTAAGSATSRGAFQLTSSVIDYVSRPPGLTNARDVYALYVEGDSMEPRFEPGDLVFISPHKPVRINDAVIIQEPNSNNGEPQAFIKILRRRTAEHIITRQLNPESEVKFINHKGTKLHKVLTMNELFGL